MRCNAHPVKGFCVWYYNTVVEKRTVDGQIVHVIGASGRSGSALCAAILAVGGRIVPVVRDASRWVGTSVVGEPRVADIEDAAALSLALQDATTVVSCAHARHAAAVLAASPGRARFIFLGSTRKFTRWPDAHGNGVKAGEAAFLASGRHGVMLHPTMIYGAQGEDNVQRLAALLRRLPVVPLPDGGAAMVQPIHQADVTRAIMAALAREWDGPHSLVIAGPAQLTYADFVRAVAGAAGLPSPRIIGVPGALLIAASALTRLPGIPRVHPDELRRLMENKGFDVLPMQEALGFTGMPLPQGLAQTFGRA